MCSFFSSFLPGFLPYGFARRRFLQGYLPYGLAWRRFLLPVGIGTFCLIRFSTFWRFECGFVCPSIGCFLRDRLSTFWIFLFIIRHGMHGFLTMTLLVYVRPGCGILHLVGIGTFCGIMSVSFFLTVSCILFLSMSFFERGFDCPCLGFFLPFAL